MLQNALTMNKRFTRFLQQEGVGDLRKLAETPQLHGEGAAQRLLLSVARPAQLERLFAKLFDEGEFLSPHGLRALSAYHRDHPYHFDAEGYQSSIDYEPAELTTSMFGGNSNWRGPIWMPVNCVLVESLERYHRFYGDDFEIEYPTGSGKRLTLDLIVADLRDRPYRRRDLAPARRGPRPRRRPARTASKAAAMTTSKTAATAAGTVPGTPQARNTVALPRHPVPAGMNTGLGSRPTDPHPRAGDARQ